MTTTLLAVVADASSELGLPAATSALNNSDLTVTQLVALTRAVGDSLGARRLWRYLLTDGTTTTIAAQQFYALPDDYGRLVDRTMWDGTDHWPLSGPLLSTEWQYITRGIVASGPRMQYRLNQNRIEVRPVPAPASKVISYIYVSKWWIYTQPIDPLANIERKAAFTQDTDRIVFPHRLMVDAVKLRFLQAKGFDTTAVAQDLQNSLDDAIAGDTAGEKLNLAGGRMYYPLIGVQNIPDGNWP